MTILDNGLLFSAVLYLQLLLCGWVHIARGGARAASPYQSLGLWDLACSGVHGRAAIQELRFGCPTKAAYSPHSPYFANGRVKLRTWPTLPHPMHPFPRKHSPDASIPGTTSAEVGLECLPLFCCIHVVTCNFMSFSSFLFFGFSIKILLRTL